MPDELALADVVGIIYQAGANRAIWNSALDHIARVCRSPSAAILHYANPERRPFVIGCSDAAPEEVVALGRGSLLGSGRRVPMKARGLVQPELLLKQAHAQEDGSSEITEGALERLLPHIEAALEIWAATARQAFLTAEFKCESDCLPLGRVLLDKLGKPVHVNRAAQVILDARDGLAIERERLVALHRADDRALRRQIDLFASGNAENSKEVLSVERRSVAHHYAVRVSAYRSSEGKAAETSLAALEVLISDAEHDLADVAVVAACRHSFSQAEQRLLERLLQGETTEQCAASLGIATSTARLHVARMMKKTGAHRQADLVRRVLAPLVVSLRGVGALAARGDDRESGPRVADLMQSATNASE